MDQIKVISLNARGLRNKLKRASIFRYLKHNKYDIVCIQEAHLTKNDVPVWEKQWGGKLFFNEGTNRSKGEVILVSKQFVGTVVPVLERDRILVVSVKNDSFDFILVNVYAPNSSADKIAFFKNIQKHLVGYNTNDIVLVGDFNCILNKDLDNIAGQPHRDEEVYEFNRLVKYLELIDTWRVCHTWEKDFSWNRSNPFIARRLDYCLVSDNMLDHCVSCELLHVPGSDHKAVATEFNTSNFTRGPGYWKFNNNYLKNPLFVQKMNYLIEKSLDEHGDEVDSINRCVK